MKLIIKILLLTQLFILFTRSAVYIKRIMGEIKNPNYSHFENIVPCGKKPINFFEEEKHLWYFRNLGAKCE